MVIANIYNYIILQRDTRTATRHTRITTNTQIINRYEPEEAPSRTGVTASQGADV